MREYEHLMHTFEPIYDGESKILILGSFPSVKSRENDFYYGHPQNRFWRVLGKVFDEEVPQTIDEKKSFLLGHRIAVWDVIASCTIIGSSDTSIKDVIVNDFSYILEHSKIEKIYVNGAKAFELYNKYAKEKTKMEAMKLPSTSPANAAWGLERLVETWKQIRDNHN